MLYSTKVQAEVIIDNTGNVFSLPVVVTDEGILKSYLEYLVTFRWRSQSWISRSVFAVQLLIEFVNANKYVYSNSRDLFREFSNCLYTGTIGKDARDPSDLFWTGRRHDDAKALIAFITHYTDWISELKSDLNLQVNPYRSASPLEQKLNWAAFHQKKNKCFLGYLWRNGNQRKEATQVRTVRGPLGPKISSVFNPVKAFPRGEIFNLINNGFVLPGRENEKELHRRLNLRDVLITMLMHFGGLRISEAIQLYIEDIAIINEKHIQRVVKVYHPALGTSPTSVTQTRRAFLDIEYGLKPRYEYPVSNRQFAGWKSPLLTNSKHNFFTVVFFPKKAEELFFELWKLYLKYQRIPARKENEHPYAFTGRTGAPQSIKAYGASRKRAVRRIGLNYSKEDCTTAHSDRHAYGRNLAECEVRPLIIKTALHHKSIDSQSVYTQPDDLELRRALENAETNALKITELEKISQSLI